MQPLLCLCGERRGSFQRHQVREPPPQHTHPAPLSLQQDRGPGALQCMVKGLGGTLWTRACRPGAAPAASKITGAQTAPVHLGLYLELLLETVLAKCNTHLGWFKSKKTRWFCRRGFGSPQTWGRSAGLHSAWGPSPPPASVAPAAGAARFWPAGGMFP